MAFQLELDRTSRLLHSVRSSGCACLLVAFAALAVLACSSSESEPKPEPRRFRVALLTPGSIADGGWNAGAYEGLERIRDELGAEISHVETRTPAEFEESFRDYAARGYDLVFGHGFEYQDAAAAVGAEYPETIFVTTSGSTVRENVVPMVFELEQATYLCGLLAGASSRTGIVGMIGGINIPSIRSTFLAFEAGVKEVRPDASVREVFIGNFDDTAAAREAALALIEEGADFLIHQANEAGRGVFQAAEDRTSVSEPVYAFGTNANQNAMAPDVVVASATLDLPGAFVAVAKRVKAGAFEAAPIRLGMKDSVVDFVPNVKLYGRIPDKARALVSEKRAAIVAGTFTVPRGDF
jgi:basic membrane lipoprotein Med (substrate-binding protein (PBP1-ABC) superfamily)